MDTDSWIYILTAIVGFVLCYSTRSITFYGMASDNKKQVDIAAKAGQWRWPSDMHRFGDGFKTRMKDIAILGLVVVQRVIADKKTDHALVVLCFVSNVISTVLVFHIARTYWGIEAALLLWGLTLFSLWSWQTALYGAQICVAQLFFLLAIFCFQQADAYPDHSSLWHFLTGLMIGAMLFASASSRKYIPLLFGAFIYSQSKIISLPLFETYGVGKVSEYIAITTLVLSSVLFILGGGLILPRFQRKTRFLAKACIFISVHLFCTYALAKSDWFYWNQLAVLAGVSIFIVALTLPNIMENLRGYHSYSNQDSRFVLYRNFFKKMGKPIKANMRGQGYTWVIRFFYKIAPINLFCFLLAFVYCLFNLLANSYVIAWLELGNLSILLLLSLSPVIWGEVTNGPQFGRTYFPGFAGLLLLTGCAVSEFAGGAFGKSDLMWYAIVVVLAVNFIWTFIVFILDVLPARMAPALLDRELQRLNVDEFYTYDTPFNDAFVDVMIDASKVDYKVKYINAITEIDSGYLVIPGTSAKSFNMESTKLGIKGQDFDEDLSLNALIESKNINQYAVRTFKTFGTSRFWVNESEVTSYRYLILNEIGNDDRWRGQAWILDMELE
jgi:hypothetical protein